MGVATGMNADRNMSPSGHAPLCQPNDPPTGNWPLVSQMASLSSASQRCPVPPTKQLRQIRLQTVCRGCKSQGNRQPGTRYLKDTFKPPDREPQQTENTPTNCTDALRSQFSFTLDAFSYKHTMQSVQSVVLSCEHCTASAV